MPALLDAAPAAGSAAAAAAAGADDELPVTGFAFALGGDDGPSVEALRLSTVSILGVAGALSLLLVLLLLEVELTWIGSSYAGSRALAASLLSSESSSRSSRRRTVDGARAEAGAATG